MILETSTNIQTKVWGPFITTFNSTLLCRFLKNLSRQDGMFCPENNATVPPPLHLSLGIKNYIIATIIKNSSTEDSLKAERLFLSKLNLLLVQILKQDWPKKWPTFITEIIGASRSNMSLCENNMIILKLLRLLGPIH